MRINIPDDELWSYDGDNTKPNPLRFRVGNESGATARPPKSSDHNYQMNRCDNNIQYILRNALLPWDASEKYSKGARVFVNADEYECLQNNQGLIPSSNPLSWKKIYIFNKDDADKLYKVKATEQVAGIAKIASTEQVIGGTDNTSFLTIRKLLERTSTINRLGVVQLSNAHNGTSETKAVTEKALSDGLKSLPEVPTATESVAGKAKIATASQVSTGLDDTAFLTIKKLLQRTSSLVRSGVVQLSNSHNGSSETKAVTEKALSDGLKSIPKAPVATESVSGTAKIATASQVSTGTDDTAFLTVKKLLQRTASLTRLGVVQLSSSYNGSSEDKAVTEKALSDGLKSIPKAPKVPTATESVSGTAKIVTTSQVSAGTDDTAFLTVKKLLQRTANTGRTGVVQLSNTYNGSSQTKAVTEKALSDGLKSIPKAPTATESVSGTAKIATASQVTTGTDDTAFLTVKKLLQRTASLTRLGVVQLSNAYNGISEVKAVTEKALSDGIKSIPTVPEATSRIPGIVKISNDGGMGRDNIAVSEKALALNLERFKEKEFPWLDSSLVQVGRAYPTSGPTGTQPRPIDMSFSDYTNDYLSVRRGAEVMANIGGTYIVEWDNNLKIDSVPKGVTCRFDFKVLKAGRVLSQVSKTMKTGEWFESRLVTTTGLGSKEIIKFEVVVTPLSSMTTLRPIQTSGMLIKVTKATRRNK